MSKKVVEVLRQRYSAKKVVIVQQISTMQVTDRALFAGHNDSGEAA